MKTPNRNIKESQTTVQFLLGPIKIKDGLFIGDQFAAKDIEFIISNKVTHVINTVSKNIPNLYERFGIQYLSVHWTEKQQNIFDKKNNALNAIYEFVEQAMEQGQSCLIHSMYGKSRACAVLVAYMMKKYNWSLNKCLQFVNAKKEGLQIRNNYLAQMQQLQKRIMADSKLSVSWNQIKNQEDLILANTFYNAKKTQPGKSEQRSGNKRVAFAQKLVHRPQHMAATHAAGFHQPSKTPAVKLRSILKGDQQPDKQDEYTNLQKPAESALETKDDRFVSTINGNIVHVTVNNFITTDKKPQPGPSKIYNTRPFSSDGKDRQRRGYNNPGAKIHPSDSNTSTNFKNPYESRLTNKIGIGSHIGGRKKRDEPRNLMMIYDRPISAKVNEEKRKVGKPGNHISDKFGQSNDMMMGNFSKKRYPSSNARDDPFKWK